MEIQMNIALPILKCYMQFIILCFILVFTTACNFTETQDKPADLIEDNTSEPLPDSDSTPLPDPDSTPLPDSDSTPSPDSETSILNPISAKQGSDDGYSWSKYGNSDWEVDNVDLSFIRLYFILYVP
jgi:hypothetical protein